MGVPATKPTSAASSAAPQVETVKMLGVAEAVAPMAVGCRAAAAKSDESGTAVSTHTHVHHVRQNCKWDCGIACILMLLRTRGEHKAREDLIEMVGTNSVWTVEAGSVQSTAIPSIDTSTAASREMRARREKTSCRSRSLDHVTVW